MKAQEVLKQYGEGRRDFVGEDLRGESFKGKDLSGADFSQAKIQGTNFSRANLTSTQFVLAKMGLQKRWVVVLMIPVVLLAVVGGCCTGTVVGFISYIFRPHVESPVGWVSLIVFVVLSGISMITGTLPTAVLSLIAFLMAKALIADGMVAAVIAIMGVGHLSLMAALLGAGAIAGAKGFALIFSLDLSLTLVIVLILAGMNLSFGLFEAIANSLHTSLIVAITLTTSITFTFVVSLVTALLFAYMGWRGFKGNPRDARLRRIAIDFATIGGTCFRYAILTDADFSVATLKSADFREAILTGTCFYGAKKLHQTHSNGLKSILAIHQDSDG